MAWLSGTKRERGSQLACQRVCQQHFCQTSNAFALKITAAQIMEPHESGGSVQYTQLEHGTIRDRSHSQGIKFTSSKMRWQSKNNTKPRPALHLRQKHLSQNACRTFFRPDITKTLSPGPFQTTRLPSPNRIAVSRVKPKFTPCPRHMV